MFPALAFSFIVGLIIGSFANVVILRWGTGRSMNGRSGCPSCGKKLAWYELIPVVSFVLQKGRCAGCGSRISWQYPLVELAFAALFAASAYAFLDPLSLPCVPCLVPLLYAWGVVFVLVAIAVYDIKHFIIPDGLVYAFIALALAWQGYLLYFDIRTMLAVLGAGIATAAPLFALWAVSRGRWMGFGDVKLAFGMGVALGMIGGLSALVFGIWAGAAASLATIGINRLVGKRQGLTMKSEIPFGPFLVAGTLFVFITNITLLHVISAL